MAGKVTVGLASHWPCITDFSGSSTYGLSGLGEGDEQPAIHSSKEYGTLLLLPPSRNTALYIGAQAASFKKDTRILDVRRQRKCSMK